MKAITVPRDVPHDMVPAFLEGVRHGKIRDEAEGYLAQAEEQPAKADELRRKHIFYMRGFHEGRIRRSRLKGGV